MAITSAITSLLPEYRAARAEVDAIVARILDHGPDGITMPTNAEVNDARARLYRAALTIAVAVDAQVDEQYDTEVTAGRIREVTAG